MLFLIIIQQYTILTEDVGYNENGKKAQIILCD